MPPESKQSRRFLLLVGLGLAGYFAVLLGHAFIFDPWQLFHRPWFRVPMFLSNARFQNAGLINSYDFDSVIMGSSMAENFSAPEASSLLGGTFMNLSMAGSYFSERAIVLDRLFRKKKVARLIMSLDHLPTIAVGQYNPKMDPIKYRFLYNGNRLDDFRLYLDWGLCRCWNLATACQDALPGERTADIHGIYDWSSLAIFRRSFLGVSSWCALAVESKEFEAFLAELSRIAQLPPAATSPPEPTALTRKVADNLRETFSAYIEPGIRKHRTTQFYFFFPPYPRAWQSMGIRWYRENFWSYIDYIRHIVSVLDHHENARIFAFDDMDFTAKLTNYKDQSHYSAAVSSQLLHMMAAGEHELTMNNVEGYIERLIAAAAAYDLRALAEEISTCHPLGPGPSMSATE